MSSSTQGHQHRTKEAYRPMARDVIAQIAELMEQRCRELLTVLHLGPRLAGSYTPVELTPLLKLVIAAEIDSARNRLNLEDGSHSIHAEQFRNFYTGQSDWRGAAEAFLDSFREAAFRAALKERVLSKDPEVGRWMYSQPSWENAFNGVMGVASRIELMTRMSEFIQGFTRFLPMNAYGFGSVHQLEGEFNSSQAAATALTDRIFAKLLDVLSEQCAEWGLAPELLAEYREFFAAMNIRLATR